MTRSLPTLLLLCACLCISLLRAQTGARPALLPWHEKYDIENMALSWNGEYLVTIGDDHQAIISDLKKRTSLAGIDNVAYDFLEVDPRQPLFYTRSAESDSIRIQVRQFTSGKITRTVSVPYELKEHNLAHSRYGTHPIISIDHFSSGFAMCYAGTKAADSLYLVEFNESGKIYRITPGIRSRAVYAIARIKEKSWILTPDGLWCEKNGRFENVLPSLQGDTYANMKVKGDTLVLLSGYLQWLDTKTMQVFEKTSIKTFFAAGEAEITEALLMKPQHPFVVDNEGAAYLVNTKRQDLIKGKAARPYSVARFKDGKMTYPIMGPAGDAGEKFRVVSPMFAYHAAAGVFAFIRSRGDGEVDIAQKDNGHLFTLSRRHIPVENIFFLADTGQVIVQLRGYYSDGVILNLSNGKMEPVSLRENYHINTESFIGSKEFKRVDKDRQVFNPARNKFISTGTWQKGADLRINILKKDTCSVVIESGTRVSLDNENTLTWTSSHLKKTGQLALTDDENKAVSAGWYFDRFIYDSSAALLTLFWKSKTTFARETIHVVDLKAKKLAGRFQERGLLVLPGGKEYVTGTGIHKLSDKSTVMPFPEKALYGERFMCTPDGRYITFIISQYDREDEIMTWDRQQARLFTLGTHQQIKKMSRDPFTGLLFTLGLDEKIKIWDLRREDLVTEILFNASRSAYSEIADMQPSYLFLLPDGNYMGENKYYDMLAFRDHDIDYPVQQMDARFHRPDKVLQALGYADTTLVHSLRRVVEKRSSRSQLSSIKTDVRVERGKNIPFKAEGRTIEIPVSISTGDHSSVMVYVNGTALWAKPGKPLFSGKNETLIPVDLVDANNHIRVCLVDGEGRETPGDYIYINGQEEKKKSLYFVGLGLSNYKHTQNNLRYAAKDMQDIYKYLMTTTSFENVHAFTATDEKVTQKVLDSISRFLSRAKPSDQVITYYAGHGMLDTASGNYFLSTHSWDPSRLTETGINIDALNSVVASSPARKKIMLVDACNSGLPDDAGDWYAPGDTSTAVTARGFKVKNRGQGSAAVQFAFNHFNQGNGVDIMAAAAGNEFAYETDSLKNGLFTFSLLTALKTGDADADQDNGISLSELQRFVGSMVKRLSKGRQQPSFRQANLYQDVSLVASDDSYFAAMLLAAKQDHVPTLKICIENENVPVDKADQSGFTAFHYACREGSINAVKYLISRNADIRLKTSFHFSGLYLAAINRHEAVVYYLLEQGLDPKTDLIPWQMDSVLKRGTPFTVFMITQRQKMKEQEKLQYQLMRFLAAGNIHSADSLYNSSKLSPDYWHYGEGISAIYVAIFQKKQESLQWLVDHGADVNFSHVAVSGFTPLMAAAYNGNHNAAQLLLNHGANRNAKNSAGKKAIDIARENNNTEIVTLLDQ